MFEALKDEHRVAFLQMGPKRQSLNMAELNAIPLALSMIKNKNHNTFLLWTDSLSTVQNRAAVGPLINKIKDWLKQFDKVGKNVVLEWVPGHIGIAGKEEVLSDP